MTKTLSLAAAAVVIAACSASPSGTASLDPSAVRAALPQASSVQLGTPAADTTAAALTAQLPAPLDASSYQASYAVMSYWTALTVNAGVAITLDIVKAVVAFPPTSCDATSCTWGPWVGDAGLNRYELVVTKQSDAGFAWALSGQNAVTNAAFVPLVSGTAYPGPDSDHGKGAFTMNFDAQDALAHGPAYVKQDFGSVDITYDNLTTISIQATLTGGQNRDPSDPSPMNAVYSFTRDPGHGGVLQIAFENLTTLEKVTLRTRWTSTGAGRADAQDSGTDAVLGTPDDLYASQCWAGQATSFQETYDSTQPITATNVESNCVFIPASYSDLVLP
jgi:hypothetical protein